MKLFCIKKTFLLLSFIPLFSCSLFGEWDSQLLNSEQDVYSFDVLKNPEFQNLEQKVITALQNTWCSEEKAKMIMELIAVIKPKICLEIGPFIGSSTLPLLATLQYLESGPAYVIDAWSNQEAIRNLSANDPNTIWWRQVDMKAVKNQFVAMLSAWSFRCNILHIPSQKASTFFSDIDFLHLDGNFSEEGALQDTQLYVPKVASGGYILLSNIFMLIDGKMTKKKALWPIFDSCEIVCEIESGNSILFRKK